MTPDAPINESGLIQTNNKGKVHSSQVINIFFCKVATCRCQKRRCLLSHSDILYFLFYFLFPKRLLIMQLFSFFIIILIPGFDMKIDFTSQMT